MIEKIKAISEIRSKISEIKSLKSDCGFEINEGKLKKYQVDINSSMEETEEEDIDDLIHDNNTLVSKIVSVTKIEQKSVRIKCL